MTDAERESGAGSYSPPAETIEQKISRGGGFNKGGLMKKRK
jgi:hypothetical protein